MSIAPIFALLQKAELPSQQQSYSPIVSDSSIVSTGSNPPPVKERAGSKPSSLSMIRLKKDVSTIAEDTSATGIVQESSAIRYTTTQLTEAWHQYARLVKQEIHLYTTMTGAQPESTNTDDLFLVKVDSPTQESTLQQAMGDLLEYIRKKLSNHHICFQIEVVTEKNANKPFLPSEYFLSMQEKNPAFRHLVQKLGLELK